MIVTTVVLTNAAQAKFSALNADHEWRSMELGKQHQHGPQNSYPISARGLEGFNIPHLGRIVHHAVQTSQNVPLATASATKLCRAFFYLLSLHRSFVVKHAGFDYMKK